MENGPELTKRFHKELNDIQVTFSVFLSLLFGIEAIFNESYCFFTAHFMLSDQLILHAVYRVRATP